MTKIPPMKEQATLLITGGTGSFDKAVMQRFLNDPYFAETRVFSRDEKKQDDMRKQLQSDKVRLKKMYANLALDLDVAKYIIEKKL